MFSSHANKHETHKISGSKTEMQATVTVYRFNLSGTNIDLLATSKRAEFVELLRYKGKLINLQDSFFIEEDPKVFRELLSYFEAQDKDSWAPSDLKIVEKLKNSAKIYGMDDLYTKIMYIYDVLSIQFVIESNSVVQVFLIELGFKQFKNMNRYLRNLFGERLNNKRPAIRLSELADNLIFAAYMDGMRFNGTVVDNNIVLFNFCTM